MIRMLLAMHIAGGIAALLSMGIPLVARKGGRTHRRAGWVFVAGMAIVSITSLMLAADRFVTVPYEGARTSAVFLGYLGLLTGGGVSAGIRVLRHKARTSRHRHPWDVAVAASIPSLGLALGIYGLAIGAPLLVAFSLVGIFSGMGQLAYWLRPPDHRMHWWFAHMDLMIGSCIAATTAFFVNNSGRIGLGPSGDSLFIWLAPTAVGVPALIIWTRSYRRRFDAAAAKNVRPRAVAVASAALFFAIGAHRVDGQTLSPGKPGERFEVASIKAPERLQERASQILPNDSSNCYRRRWTIQGSINDAQTPPKTEPHQGREDEARHYE